MQPTRQVIPAGAVGGQTPIKFDPRINGFKASFRCYIGGATANYKVQYTLDDLSVIPAASVDWVDDVNVGSGTTSSATGNYFFPVTAVRVNVASLSLDNLVFTVLQGDDAGYTVNQGHL